MSEPIIIFNLSKLLYPKGISFSGSGTSHPSLRKLQKKTPNGVLFHELRD